MGRPRRYNLNEHYFEKIDSEDKAYWLGFIYADGYIHKRTNSHGQAVLGITLHEKEPLEKFMTCLQSDKPVKSYITKGKYNEGSVEYKAVIISNKIVSDVERLGVVEQKTFKLSGIPNISDDLIPHFIRGYFDGDGSVFLHTSLSGTGSQYYKILGIHICGTKLMLESIRKHLSSFLGDSGKTIYKERRSKNDVWGLKMLSNKRCKSFYEFIYPIGTTIYLDRKKKVFEDYFEMYEKGEHKMGKTKKLVDNNSPM